MQELDIGDEQYNNSTSNFIIVSYNIEIILNNIIDEDLLYLQQL